MDDIIELGKNLGMFLAEMIVAISVCNQVLQKKFRKPDISKIVPKQNKIDLDIINKMEYAKEILNADRIHVYEFHNGEHYADYRSSCKFSCSYEVVRAGKEAVSTKCKALPIAIMPRFINKITTDGLFRCDDIELIRDEMISTYTFKKELGIKSFYDVALKNSQGVIIGFVAIQWNDSVPRINVEEIDKLAWYIEEKICEAVQLNR